MKKCKLKYQNLIQIFTIFSIMIFSVNCSDNQACICSNPLLDSATVVHCDYVVDGDTWRFHIGNEEISVRILNIDCFEIHTGERLDGQADEAGISSDSALTIGKAAKKFMDSLITGKEIKIVRDYNESNQDVYNRLLRKCYYKNILVDSILFARGYGLRYN
ncbi:MAG: TNase-like protein [Ignavibacteria bacterium]|nr:TNase-like protein [Ignavibacteria bacterium]